MINVGVRWRMGDEQCFVMGTLTRDIRGTELMNGEFDHDGERWRIFQFGVDRKYPVDPADYYERGAVVSLLARKV